MIVLLWIYFNAISLLIGFELNASIYNAKKEEKNQKVNRLWIKEEIVITDVRSEFNNFQYFIVIIAFYIDKIDTRQKSWKINFHRDP